MDGRHVVVASVAIEFMSGIFLGADARGTNAEARLGNHTAFKGNHGGRSDT
jgi:hypothetical protein